MKAREVQHLFRHKINVEDIRNHGGNCLLLFNKNRDFSNNMTGVFDKAEEDTSVFGYFTYLEPFGSQNYRIIDKNGDSTDGTIVFTDNTSNNSITVSFYLTEDSVTPEYSFEYSKEDDCNGFCLIKVTEVGAFALNPSNYTFDHTVIER